ncbi:right-handed parallel beta-helix repeat-containing protein [candidate division CSSED10-310 bacterium]|uniref:Right-handed parallel beta-helix repeat-containing protein n=1 Tax=candidate division CSSED10-310 bacterium TaxID=2855610 RepID=A0ABV6YSH1_UNCC1
MNQLLRKLFRSILTVIFLFSILIVESCPDSSESNPLDPDSLGNNYFVSLSGDNGNEGQSQDDAWRTLQFAVDNVAPGDTISVLSGTYEGCRIENSGTSEQWITLRVNPGDAVLLNTPGTNAVHDSIIEVETWAGDGVVAYWIIDGFEVANAPGAGIDLRGNSTNLSHDLTVRNNTVHHNGLSSGKTGIFTAFIDHVLIEGNESYNNGEHGIYHSNSGDQPTISENTLHDNNNCGIHMNGDASMGNDGFISGALVEANIVYGNGTGGGSGINMDGVTDSVIRNNLLYNNHAGGIALYQVDGAVCSQNNRVLNNTIVMADDGRWCINISQTGCINNKLFNNIIYTYHSWRGSIVLPATGISGFESDYNVVMNRFSTDDGDTRITLAQWQALGYDLHSIIATPTELFVAAPDDYHLDENSPAIDQGTNLPDVPVDLEGTTRPQGNGYDIGAYEYQDNQTVPALHPWLIVQTIILLGFFLRNARR